SLCFTHSRRTCVASRGPRPRQGGFALQDAAHRGHPTRLRLVFCASAGRSEVVQRRQRQDAAAPRVRSGAWFGVIDLLAINLDLSVVQKVPGDRSLPSPWRRTPVGDFGRRGRVSALLHPYDRDLPLVASRPRAGGQGLSPQLAVGGP